MTLQSSVIMGNNWAAPYQDYSIMVFHGCIWSSNKLPRPSLQKQFESGVIQILSCALCLGLGCQSIVYYTMPHWRTSVSYAVLLRENSQPSHGLDHQEWRRHWMTVSYWLGTPGGIRSYLPFMLNHPSCDPWPHVSPFLAEEGLVEIHDGTGTTSLDPVTTWLGWWILAMNLRHQRLAKLGWEKTISKGSTGFCVGLHWWNATFPEKLAVLERSSMAQCIRCGHRGIFVSLSKFDKTTSQYKMMYAVESFYTPTGTNTTMTKPLPAAQQPTQRQSNPLYLSSWKEKKQKKKHNISQDLAGYPCHSLQRDPHLPQTVNPPTLEKTPHPTPLHRLSFQTNPFVRQRGPLSS